MKRLKIISTLIILCLTFSNLTVKAQTKAELTITIKDCRDAKNFEYLSELKIKKNGSDFITLKPQHENKQILKDLELGTYTLIYKTLFDKKESITVNITENKKYNSTICTDYIDYSKETYKPIIDKLSENESYKIHLSSQGCFHSTENTIIIKRTKDIYSIIWGDKSKKLDKQDVEAIRQFELELNYMTDGGCTTTDTYIVEYKGTKKQIDDGSCSWNGDYYLKKQIFGEK